MTIADTYRQYAAECVSLAQQRENADDKAVFIEMATMWLRLADLAERVEGTKMPPSTE